MDSGKFMLISSLIFNKINFEDKKALAKVNWTNYHGLRHLFKMKEIGKKTFSFSKSGCGNWTASVRGDLHKIENIFGIHCDQECLACYSILLNHRCHYLNRHSDADDTVACSVFHYTDNETGEMIKYYWSVNDWELLRI